MKKPGSVWLVRFGFVLAVFFGLTAKAQEAEEDESESGADTATVVSALDLVPEILEDEMDSPVSSFLLKDRFEYLQNEIPLRYNEHSHRYVDFFVYKRSSFTRRMLETKDLYFPIFEKKLAHYKLPEELKYLPLIESGLNPRITSRAGAGGLWQFMRATGREFGLQQNHFIDERFHPEKSTEAACRYLKQLHTIFGDWEVALAAYNCGPGNVRRAIRRTGRSDFWGIYPVLPKETRNYVPQFVAMVYLMNYSRDHGIVAGDLKLIPVSDTLHVKGYLNLHTFASLGGMSIEDIYEHNPHLVGTYIPHSSESFRLTIPATKAALLADEMIAILDSSSRMPSNASVHLAETRRTVKDGYEVVTTSERHTVRSGQTLSSIARQHGVTVSQLKSWNSLKGTMLKKGQRLVVHKHARRPLKNEQVEAPVVLAAAKETKKDTTNPKAEVQLTELSPEEEVAKEEEVIVAEVPGAPMTEAMLLARQAQKLKEKGGLKKESVAKAPVTVDHSPVVRESGNVVHTIKKGETLISIANLYKVRAGEIQKLNNLQGSKLVAGKTLQITGTPGRPLTGAGNQNVYHVVQAGDTLWAISRKYGLSVDKIKKVNNIRGSALKAGMKILISG